MPRLVTALGLVIVQDFVLVVQDIPLAIMGCTFMMTTSGSWNNTAISLTIID